MARTTEEDKRHLHSTTAGLITREAERRRKDIASAKNPTIHSLKQAARRAFRWSKTKGHYRDYINVTAREHMSSVDCFDGKKARSGELDNDQVGTRMVDEDLLTI